VLRLLRRRPSFPSVSVQPQKDGAVSVLLSDCRILAVRPHPDQSRTDGTVANTAGSRTAAQTREHLFRHCSRWKDQQKTLWKGVGKATGWRAGRCRHVQVSELLSMEKCDKAVMDFLGATDVGKFPSKLGGGVRVGGLSLISSLFLCIVSTAFRCFHLSEGDDG